MNPRHLLALGTLALTAITSPSFAQSGHGNGAGLVYLNGVAQIYDPFVKPAYAEEVMRLTPEAITLLKSIQELLEIRGFMVKDFFEKRVFDDLVEYFYANELPEGCDSMAGLKASEGKKVTDVACTQNKVTYILKDRFEELSFLDRGLVIIHERLHAQYPNAAHHWITGFIEGVRRIIEIKILQANGNRDPISSEDLELFRDMYVHARRMEMQITRDVKRESLCRQLASGGGLVCYEKTHRLSLPSDFEPIYTQLDMVAKHFNESGVFLGITSLVTSGNLEGYETWKRSQILDSNIQSDTDSCKRYFDSCNPLSASQVSDSVITGSHLLDTRVRNHSIVENSDIKNGVIEKNSTVRRSTLHNISLSQSLFEECTWKQFPHQKWSSYAKQAKCIKSSLRHDEGFPFEYTNGGLYPYYPALALQLEAGAILENSSLIVSSWARNNPVRGKVQIRGNTHVKSLQLHHRADSSFAVRRFQLVFDSPDSPLIFPENKEYKIKTKNLLLNHPRKFYLFSIADLDDYNVNQ